MEDCEGDLVTCQNCADPLEDCPACPACAATEYPPVSALGVAERLRNAERTRRPMITETHLVVLGSTVGMMFGVIAVALLIVWLTL